MLQPLLTGKTVLITGAAGGIGRALVRGFAEAGANVAAADLDISAISDDFACLPTVHCVPLDVTDSAAIDRALEAIAKRFGPVDVLVNNAGIKSAEALLSGDRDRIARCMAVNADAVLALTRAVFNASLKARGGRVVNIGSSISSKGAVFNYQAGGADYCLSKAVVHDLTQLLAYEAAPFDVTVNVVAPGIIHTPMHGRPAEETEARHGGRIPLGRIGQPEDLVGATLFLASDAAAYITGQVLHVNGGMTMND